MLCAKNAFNDKPLTSMQIMHPHTVFLLGMCILVNTDLATGEENILWTNWRCISTVHTIHLPVLQLILRARINHRALLVCIQRICLCVYVKMRRCAEYVYRYPVETHPNVLHVGIESACMCSLVAVFNVCPVWNVQCACLKCVCVCVWKWNL